jgi:hypothetical protein
MGLYAQNNQQSLAIASGEKALAILKQLQQQGKLYGRHKTWPEGVKKLLDEIKHRKNK